MALGYGQLTINGGGIDNSSSAAFTLATNTAQNWNGGFTFVGTQDLNMGTGEVTLGSNCQVTVNSHRLIVPGAISGNYNLTKAGSGTLVLGGENFSFTGETIVNGGILQIGNAYAIENGGLTVNGGSVDLNGFEIYLSSLSGSGGVITDNSVPASPPSPTQLSFFYGSSNSTYGGSISKGANGQDIALNISTSGIFTLSGTSNYSGGTVISEGTLAVTGALLGGGNVQIDSGTTLAGSGLVAAASWDSRAPQSLRRAISRWETARPSPDSTMPGR